MKHCSTSDRAGGRAGRAAVDEEVPLDGADGAGREGEVLGLVVKDLLGSRPYLAQRSAAADQPGSPD